MWLHSWGFQGRVNCLIKFLSRTFLLLYSHFPPSSLSSRTGLGATGPNLAPATLGWALPGGTQPCTSGGPAMHLV